VVSTVQAAPNAVSMGMKRHCNVVLTSELFSVSLRLRPVLICLRADPVRALLTDQ